MPVFSFSTILLLIKNCKLCLLFTDFMFWDLMLLSFRSNNNGRDCEPQLIFTYRQLIRQSIDNCDENASNLQSMQSQLLIFVKLKRAYKKVCLIYAMVYTCSSILNICLYAHLK